MTFEVTGTKGTQVFTFVSGTALSAVTFAINQVRDATGVTARLRNPADQTSGMYLESGAYGSESFVSVRRINKGDFFQTYSMPGGSASNRDSGEDVLALINGNLALGDGTKVGLHTSTLNMELNLTTAAATQTGVYRFAVAGGGAKYQLGPSVNSQQQVGFGIQSIASSHLAIRRWGSSIPWCPAVKTVW